MGTHIRRAVAADDRVAKAITSEGLDDGGKLHPAKIPGSGLLEDESKVAVPRIEEKPDVRIKERRKAVTQSDPISKIRDVKTYDPSRVTDAVLRDDFRIILAWYSSWKKDPENFKHDKATLEKLLRAILKEAIRRGPKVIQFNPKGMAPVTRAFFEEVAAQVRVPPAMLKRVKLAPDTDPGDLTTAELLEAHDVTHLMYRVEGESQRGVKGWSLEDIVNTHALVVDELIERKKRHPPPPDDGLDEVSDEFEAVEKRYAVVRPSGSKEGKEIKLADVLPHFESFKIRKPYVYLVGGLANHGKTKGDIDILVKDSDKLPEELKHVIHFRLGRALPPELAERLSIHYDKFYGPFTKHVQLYDLAFEAIPERKVIEMRAQEVEMVVEEESVWKRDDAYAEAEDEKDKD